MVTPFRADGAIDFDVAIELATYLVAEGCDGLVVAGSTGEGSSLSDKEKLELFACVAGASRFRSWPDDLRDTARSVELTRQVLDTVSRRVGDHAGVRASQSKGHRRALRRHRLVHGTPIMLYDIRCAREKDRASTTIDLVTSHANIVAIKDASATS